MVALTKAEEKVMQALWKLKKAFVKDLVETLDEVPKPAYTTVSTIVRILEQKGMVGYQAFGKTHEYYPLITKEQYRNNSLTNLVTNYFEGSPAQVLNYLAQTEKFDNNDIAALKEIIKKHKPN